MAAGIGPANNRLPGYSSLFLIPLGVLSVSALAVGTFVIDTFKRSLAAIVGPAFVGAAAIGLLAIVHLHFDIDSAIKSSAAGLFVQNMLTYRFGLFGCAAGLIAVGAGGLFDFVGNVQKG